MSIVKVSIYQKNLDDGLNLTSLKKLASLKSDFLLFPEYFYADSSVKDFRSIPDKSQYAQDWLLKLNDSYKGVILGGSLIRGTDGARFGSEPIISQGQIVDWYDKRTPSSEEKEFIQPGGEPGVFILSGSRFGVLLGDDARNPAFLKELSDQGVKLIFILQTAESFDPEQDEELIIKPAREEGLFIVRCCGAGSKFGRALSGSSLVATPTGITWRVAPQEADREILKTVLIAGAS